MFLFDNQQIDSIPFGLFTDVFGFFHIRRIDNVLVFNVGPDEGRTDMKFKSEAAVRTIPVHTRLIELGFVEFVDRQKENGNVSLFPDAEIDARGYRSDKFGKWFARFIRFATTFGMQCAMRMSRVNGYWLWVDGRTAVVRKRVMVVVFRQ